MNRCRAVLVLALLAVAGCTSGSSSDLPTTTATDPASGLPRLPGPPTTGDTASSRPSLPPRPGLPVRPPGQTCLPTAAFGCVTPSEYWRQQASIAREHEGQADFSRQWGLGAINAADAYAHLELARGHAALPGAGVTVGLVDSGIDLEHPLFTGDISEEFLLSAEDEVGNRDSHGTAVASVIAADPLGLVPTDRHLGFRGVALGASLRMFAIPVGRDAPPLYDPIALPRFGDPDAELGSVFTHALSRRVDILSASIGFHGIIDSYSEPDLRNALGDTIAAMAQAGVTEKKILVLAGGNAHGFPCSPGTEHCVGGSVDPPVDGRIDAASVEILPGSPVRIAELRGHTIAVVAVSEDVDADGRPDIASFSNRCGIAAEWCIAAPGANVRIALFGARDGVEGQRGVTAADGTSFAAPMVAGGLAIMKQLFRNQLSSTDLVDRLFLTADKQAPYGDAAIYGQGLMDLGAATAPVGAAALTTSETVTGGGVDVEASAMMSGRAVGDGLARSLSGQEIAAFDSLGAPFWFRLSDFAYPDPGPTMSQRLARLLARSPPAPRQPIAQRLTGSAWTGAPAPWRSRAVHSWFGVPDRIAGDDRGHLSLAENALTFALESGRGVSATVFTTADDSRLAPVAGLSLTVWPGMAPAHFRVGWLAERRTLLGTATAGAFGRLSASTAFAGASAAGEVGAWQLFADAEFGAVAPRVRDGMITAISPLMTSAFSVAASRRLGARDTLSFGLSQALRVEDGDASLSVPVGRDKKGGLLRSLLRAELAPSGRQVDVSAYWRRALGPVGELRTEITWTREPGHNAHADSSWQVLAGWRTAY